MTHRWWYCVLKVQWEVFLNCNLNSSVLCFIRNLTQIASWRCFLWFCMVRIAMKPSSESIKAIHFCVHWNRHVFFHQTQFITDDSCVSWSHWQKQMKCFLMTLYFSHSPAITDIIIYMLMPLHRVQTVSFLVENITHQKKTLKHCKLFSIIFLIVWMLCNNCTYVCPHYFVYRCGRNPTETVGTVGR